MNTTAFSSELTFPIRKEKIDTIGVDISAKYESPQGWFSGEISYSYQDRKSNLNGGDLVSNVGTVSLGLSF